MPTLPVDPPRGDHVPSASDADGIGRIIAWYGDRSIPEQVVIAAAVIVGLLILILGILMSGGSEAATPVADAPTPQERVVYVETTATPVATLTPSCPTISTVNRLLESADYDTAFRVARLALTDSKECSGAEQQVAELMLEAGYRAITSQPARPEDPIVQQAQVDRYQTLVNLAAEYGIPMPATSRQIAADAYAASAFLLAKRAWEDAFANGEVTTADQQQVRFYTSVLRNLGEHYANLGTTPEARVDGLRYLVASCTIDRNYRVGDGTACGTLKHLLGPDESTWPESAASPLLEPDETDAVTGTLRHVA